MTADVITLKSSVVFDSSVLPEQRLPFSRVRLPPKPGTTGADGITFVENQEVEVYSTPNESDVGGWWKSIVKVPPS